jgi:hypothetical protein
LAAVTDETTTPTDPSAPDGPRPVQYKGEPLDAERGPGLGCFRFQVAVLALLIVLTPLSVAWRWSEWLSAALLFAVILLLLVAGQTIIFLLRLVAADRRAAGRRRPLASGTKTVGELEDERRSADHAASERAPGDDEPATAERAIDDAEHASNDSGPVRQ